MLFDEAEMVHCGAKHTTETEGIKYAGSKRELIRYILDVIEPLKVRTVFDAFSGSTRVSQALAKNGYQVIANDVAVWSKVFATCYLLNKKDPSIYQPMVDHLNGLPGYDGWFTEHYGGDPNDGCSVQQDGKKRIWQRHNTRKLDAIREEIDRIVTDEIEQCVLLTSLILAMDRVDSTVGHHVSYLRDWAPRAYETMCMVVPKTWKNVTEHTVLHDDVFQIVPNIEVDLAYYDPPYGSSNEKMPPSRVRYASYYHLWTTICLNDRPQLTGVANRRKDVGDVQAASIFEEFRRAPNGRYVVIEAIERLIRQTRAKYILLSYNNQGRTTRDEIVETVLDLGLKHEIVEIDHKSHVMTGMRWTNEWIDESRDSTREYLFLLSR